MSKTILIVDSDAHVSSSLAAALEARGFNVSETGDGKAAVDLVRTGRPDLVVLAVELSAGQNGYLVCGKLKKDDELKDVPIIITGNPDGFAQHRKLKAHADDYVAKPVDPADLVERVGAIVGFPAAPAGGGSLVDDGIALAGLDDDEGEAIVTDFGGDEITIDSDLAPVSSPDDGLDLLDAAFDGISDTTALAGGEPAEPAALEATSYAPEGAVDGLDAFGEDASTDVLEFTPGPSAVPPPPPARALSTPPPPTPAPSTPPPPRAFTPASGGSDAAELRSLRAKVAELQHALDDAQSQAGSHESRVRELEAELDAKAGELEAARASGGRNDKETFALREAANRKDKEILRLKTELNEKEQELLELRDREVQLEQRASESGDELARRDAQLKTLTTRLEAAAADKRRTDGLLAQAKEEARGAVARFAALQADAEQAQALSAEVEALRGQLGELEAQGQQQLEQARAEATQARAQLERAEAQAAQERTRAQAGERELEALRRRAAELEEQAGRHEERLTKLYGRLKQDERLRDKARKALQVAQQLLEEESLEAGGAGGDEDAAA